MLSQAALTDNGSLAHEELMVTAREPALAALPNGRLAAAWIQNQLDLATGRTNSNLFLAILDGSGQVMAGPLDVTGNDAWRGQDPDGAPLYTSPRLAALGENRLLVAWIDLRRQEAGEASALDYAVYTAGGEVFRPPSRLVEGEAGTSVLIDPALAGLADRRALAVYSVFEEAAGRYSLAYLLLEGDGDLGQGSRPIPEGNGWRADAIQLGSGNVLVAWTDPEARGIAYQLLDGSGAGPLGSRALLSTPGGRAPDYISLAAVERGMGVLTWMDATWKDYLYYALVDGEGSLLTPAMIVAAGSASDPLILSSLNGQGVAPYEEVLQAFLPHVER